MNRAAPEITFSPFSLLRRRFNQLAEKTRIVLAGGGTNLSRVRPLM
jgi:hypothetical protein